MLSAFEATIDILILSTTALIAQRSISAIRSVEQRSSSAWHQEYRAHQCGSILAARSNIEDAIAWRRAERMPPSAALSEELRNLRDGHCGSLDSFTTKIFREANPALDPRYPNWNYRIERNDPNGH